MTRKRVNSVNWQDTKATKQERVEYNEREHAKCMNCYFLEHPAEAIVKVGKENIRTNWVCPSCSHFYRRRMDTKRYSYYKPVKIEVRK